MPTNLYFQNVTSHAEQELVNSLTSEVIQIHGMDVFYLPRTLVKEDLIMGEDVLSKFSTAYEIEMYLKTTEGFGGEGDLVSKFGLDVRDEVIFTVHKDRFELATDLTKPLEGDLVYLPISKGLFEIKFVEHEQPFYQQSALPVYKLSCTKWEYASERIDTGITDIDTVEDSLSTDTMNWQFTLEAETGSIVIESDIDEISYLINEDFTMATQQPVDQGKIFEDRAGTTPGSTYDDILDFSERNPFGEVDSY